MTLKGPPPLVTVVMVRWCSVMVRPRVWKVAPALLLLLPGDGLGPSLPPATSFSADDSTSIRGGFSGRRMPMPAKNEMICMDIHKGWQKRMHPQRDCNSSSEIVSKCSVMKGIAEPSCQPMLVEPAFIC